MGLSALTIQNRYLKFIINVKLPITIMGQTGLIFFATQYMHWWRVDCCPQDICPRNARYCFLLGQYVLRLYFSFSAIFVHMRFVYMYLPDRRSVADPDNFAPDPDPAGIWPNVEKCQIIFVIVIPCRSRFLLEERII